MTEPQAAPTPSIALPMMAGIGNSVMTIPLVRAVAQTLKARITILARTAAIGDVFRGLPEVAQIEVLGGHGLQAWQQHRRLVRQLRPDVYLVPYPSNRWQYSLLAAASCADHVVMHSYPTGGLRALRFVPRLLQRTTFVPAMRGIHDSVQNMCLLMGLRRELAAGALEGFAHQSMGRGMEAVTIDSVVVPPIMHVSEADRSAAARALQGASAEGPFIALQPGCGDTLIGAAKRWPAQNFAQLADTLAARGHLIIVLEGPDERGVGQQVSALSRSRPRVIQLTGPLGHAAAILQAARLYVGNDSGLAHVAAAVGTPPVSLFAAADPVRVAPFGFDHLVVTPPAVNGRAWQPRLLYPIDYPRPRLTDSGGIDWAAHIRLEDVLAAVELALAQSQYRLTRT